MARVGRSGWPMQCVRAEGGAGRTAGAGDELTMAGMLDAIGPRSLPGDCNDGFFRDDALLVVIMVTDEDDVGKSPGDPGLWRDAIIEFKNGVEDRIVVIGMIGDRDLPNPICEELTDTTGAEPSPRLREFITSFGDMGLDASVCQDDYSGTLEEDMAMIETACKRGLP